jgi:hypothetical protein
LRKEIGQISQHLQGKLSHRKQNRSNLQNKNKQEIEEILDTKKQKLQALSKRLRRYKISNQRRSDNKSFETNQKLFYRNFDKDQTIHNIPNINEVTQFWKNTWSNPVDHTSQPSSRESEESQHIDDMPEFIIMSEDVTATHEPIAKIFNNLIHTPNLTPTFLTQGITYLEPKDSDTTNPSKYRPITCLPTLYKLLTSIITNKINVHIKKHNIIPEEQKGCCKGSRGCKEQLIIDTEIHNQVRQKHRNLHYAYIDYQKAFDSVPHSWLLHILALYKIDKQLIAFLKHVMTKWSTTLNIKLKMKTYHLNPSISQEVYFKETP